MDIWEAAVFCNATEGLFLLIALWATTYSKGKYTSHCFPSEILHLPCLIWSILVIYFPPQNKSWKIFTYTNSF